MLQKTVYTEKAVNVYRSKSRAKVIEWETQQYSRGTKDILVEVKPTRNKLKLIKGAAGWTGTENNVLEGQTTLQPMDVDKTF